MTQVPVQISSGPRQLKLMPAAEQAGLDPYMQLIVGYRKSGLSLNHIVGCPLDCGYCVRHFWGNFDDKIPTLLVPTQEAIELLIGHEAFRPHVTPIQLFNKATDPFLPGVKPHLFQVLRALDERAYTNHVLITRRRSTCYSSRWRPSRSVTAMRGWSSDVRPLGKRPGS